jgi:3-oxoacyl-[acyl-carrier-protein] synthase III
MYEFIITLLQAVLVAAVPVVAAFAAKLLHAKAEETRKDIKTSLLSTAKWRAEDAIAAAVCYTAQTYVDALKKSGQFSKENQLLALNMAKGKARELLTLEARLILKEAYGNIDDYLTTLIEAEIGGRKNEDN